MQIEENMNNEERPEIPYPVKRAVRKRCGFGCVVCGLPIYDYDHMTPWSEVKEHKEENLTLLCDMHHREKTSGLLPESDVRKSNDDPFNKRSGQTEPLKLHYQGTRFHVRMGKTKFSVDQLRDQDFLVPLVIDGHPMIFFSKEEDQLFLNLYLYDQYNHPILVIQQNELVVSSSAWDITFISNCLRINLASRNILMVIHFNPPDEIWIERGVFLLNGVKFEITADSFTYDRSQLILGEVQSQIGIVLGTAVFHPMIDTYGAVLLQEKVDRYH